MANWIKFKHKGEIHTGILSNNEIALYEGNMFNNPIDSRKRISLNEVELLNPCSPSKIIALWNNYNFFLRNLRNYFLSHYSTYIYRVMNKSRKNR